MYVFTNQSFMKRVPSHCFCLFFYKRNEFNIFFSNSLSERERKNALFQYYYLSFFQPNRPESPALSLKSALSDSSGPSTMSVPQSESAGSALGGSAQQWQPSSGWVLSWKNKLPLQTIMRLLQVLVPQVEKICIDKCVLFLKLLVV